MKETTLTGESKDILNENIETLKELFPEIVSEDKIDFDKFKTIFGGEIDDSSERYAFTWPGKTQSIKESQKQSTGTLRPCKEESKNWDSTQNLYIEGDNLEVLKLLQKGYFNKIKAIYIDPPYNTGKDFIYPDNYQDNLQNYLEFSGQVSNLGESKFKLTTNVETTGRFHTNWINMMYPRIKLARNLLSFEGAIFISIDDNEVENLKKICDEIFGEENRIGTIPILSNPRGRQSSQFIAETHEYCLIYAKNYQTCGIRGLDLNENQKKEYNLEDEKGHYRLLGLRLRGGRATAAESPTLHFPIYYSINEDDFYLEKQHDDDFEIIPKFQDGTLGTWRWSKKKILNQKDELIVKPVKDRYDVFQKDYLTDDKRRKVKSLWDEKEINYDLSSNELKALFDKKVFDYAKPLYLLNKIFSIIIDDNSLILDFFSGSGTSAHSILKLNSNNNNNCKFIMVQIPEELDENSDAFKAGYKNICEIGKERIRRAGDKIVQESGNKDLDIGFKVFKLDSSNLNKWDPDYDDLEQTLLVSQDNIKPDRTQEDLIYEIMLKYGIDLTLPIEEYDAGENKIYSIGFGALLICLDNKITKDIADSIIELASEDVSRVVFKDNGFASDADKTNIKETLRTHGIDEFITI